jgi:hypothetical protein
MMCEWVVIHSIEQNSTMQNMSFEFINNACA